jgi:hypothetical protein
MEEYQYGGGGRGNYGSSSHGGDGMSSYNSKISFGSPGQYSGSGPYGGSGSSYTASNGGGDYNSGGGDRRQPPISQACGCLILLILLCCKALPLLRSNGFIFPSARGTTVAETVGIRNTAIGVILAEKLVRTLVMTMHLEGKKLGGSTCQDLEVALEVLLDEAEAATSFLKGTGPVLILRKLS